MRLYIAILLAALPLSLPPVVLAQDSINPDAAADEGDGSQIVVPQRKQAPMPPTDLRPAAASAKIEIDAQACRYVVEHVPSADTEYTPGVDVNGNPVAPADLAPRSPIKFPSRFAIPITSNVARMLGSAAPGATGGTTGTAGTAGTAGTTTATSTTTTPANASGTASAPAGPGYRADALIGMVTLEDGRLSFNGQPIGDDPDAELAALCRTAAPQKKTGGAQ